MLSGGMFLASAFRRVSFADIGQVGAKAYDILRKMPETEIPDWVSEWRAAYSVLFIKSIAGEALPIAVLLLDILNDRLFFRFRGDLPAIADKQSLAVIEGMRDELADWASEQSATALFRMFLDTLSNSITMSDPREVAPDSNPIESLDRIFAQEIPNSKSFRV